jgi:TPM domain
MTMDHDSQAGPKSAAGLAFGRLKDLLETHDRGFKGAFSGMHGSRQHYPVSRSARFGIAPCLVAALVLCLASVALAFNFPPLTGRVVDQANIMSVQSRNDLEARLKDLENKSGIQLVVATVKSLEGSDVETYANELFRNWKLGEAKKNNGASTAALGEKLADRASAMRLRCFGLARLSDTLIRQGEYDAGLATVEEGLRIEEETGNR